MDPKDPKIWMLGGVGIFAALILLKGKSSSPTAAALPTSGVAPSGNTPTSSTTSTDLSGAGMQFPPFSVAPVSIQQLGPDDPLWGGHPPIGPTSPTLSITDTLQGGHPPIMQGPNGPVGTGEVVNETGKMWPISMPFFYDNNSISPVLPNSGAGGTNFWVQ